MNPCGNLTVCLTETYKQEIIHGKILKHGEKPQCLNFSSLQKKIKSM